MFAICSLGAALLFGAPLLVAQTQAPAVLTQNPHTDDLRDRSSFLLYFSLEEDEAKILEKFGTPNQVADFSDTYQSWQYHFNQLDKHDFSHTLLIRRADKKLMSITRNTEHEENVDPLFPPQMTSTHYWPSAAKPEYGARLRRLSGDRVLIAMGSPKKGDSSRQIILIRRSALSTFIPWIEPQVAEVEKKDAANKDKVAASQSR